MAEDDHECAKYKDQGARALEELLESLLGVKQFLRWLVRAERLANELHVPPSACNQALTSVRLMSAGRCLRV